MASVGTKKPKGARVFSFWVVARRSPDVAGEWEVHCLELDLVTQGRSLRHAFDMIAEAASMTLVSDLSAQRDPGERRAPEQFWNDLWRILRDGQPLSSDQAFAPGRRIAVLAAQIQFTVVAKKPKAGVAPKWELPAAWSQATAA